MIHMRLFFSKIGRAKYISHLDCMHVFQRVFYRLDLPLKYSQGFNPHAYLSIALPLPVGIESECEILDFDLEIMTQNLPERLNEILPEGLIIHKAVVFDRSIQDISFLLYKANIQTSADITSLNELFSGELMVEKRNKKKQMVTIDLMKMIKSIEFTPYENYILCNAVLTAQNPTCNPNLLIAAISKYLDETAQANFIRKQLFDAEMQEFV